MHAESPNSIPTTAEPDSSNTDRIYLEAWEKTKGMKAKFWQACIAIILTYVIANNLILIPVGLITSNTDSTLYVFLSSATTLMIQVFILTPLFAGLLMISIKHCSGLRAPINNLFHYLPYWKRLWVFPVILSGFDYAETIFENQPVIEATLYVLSSVWIILYFMAIPLAIDQHYSLATVFEVTRKTMLQNWVRLLGFLFVAMIIFSVNVFTLGIAFIWTVPWFCNAIAVFYRELFGVQISLV